MGLYTRLSLRFIKTHPRHSALSIVGIALGIAVVLAIDLSNESARRAFQLSSEALSAGSTHTIYGGPQGIDERHYRDLRITQGMRNISPVVAGYVSLDRQRFMLLGIDAFTAAGSAAAPRRQDNLNPELLLNADNGVFILDSTAADLNLAPPVVARIEIGGLHHPLHIVGVLQPANPLHRHGLRNVLITDISTAQSVLGMPGLLSRIEVNADDAEAVRARLPPSLTLTPNDVRDQTMQQMTRAFHLNLSALSLLALVIGAFLIYNAMTLSVLQRRTQFAVLRMLGVTPRRLLVIVLAEAFVLAAIGFIVGGTAGVLLSKSLLQMVAGTINDLYFEIEVQAVSVPLRSVIKAALLAFAGTLLAAWLPAWEAMRATPAHNAVRSKVETEARSRSTWLLLTGACMWLSAVIVLLVSERSIIAGFSALFLVILGFSLATPLVMLKLLDFINLVLNRWFGVIGRMAGRGVRSSLSRTQVAVAALAISVAAVVGVSVMISSFRGSVEHWLNDFLRADIYIAQQYTHKHNGIDTGLIDAIAAMPEVRAISTGRWTTLQSGAGFTQLFAVELDLDAFKNYQLKSGDSEALWPEFSRQNSVIVSEPYAYHHRLTVGDSIVLPTDSGSRAFNIASVFYDYGSDQGIVVMHRATYNRHWQDSVISSVSLYLDHSADAESFVAHLNRDQLISSTLRVRSSRTIRQRSLQIFDRTFIITDVLRLLAICIAMVGILSALMAIQLERSREFAVLRAAGLTPRQLWGLVTAESGLMGFIAGIMACPLGLIMAWILIFVINQRSFGWSMQLRAELEPWLTALVLSTAAAVIAGFYPAWRMSRSTAAACLHYE